MKENVEELYNYLNIEDFEKILKLLSEEILPLLNIWQTIIKKSIVS